MTTQKLPGADAARHGTGDADLAIMLAAHDAFRRDLLPPPLRLLYRAVWKRRFEKTPRW